MLQDNHKDFEVVEHDQIWTGPAFGLAGDMVRLEPGHDPVGRQYLTHPGAVSIAAVRGEAGSEEILLIRQYRHPVRSELWEIPAGLLDHPGEDPLEAAKRELAEETDLGADRWDVLIDYFTSPGNSQEALRVFLARDLHTVETDFVREDEEAQMERRWVPLDDALDAVFGGGFHNPSAVLGTLAVARARDRGWQGLRTPDAPWFR